MPNNYKITISLPCYGRPVETRRAIQSVIDQDINGWELLVTGDGCPEFEKLMPWIDVQQYRQGKKGNSIVYENLLLNTGHWGTAITNANIQRARGEYFCFLANDDWFDKGHLSNLLYNVMGNDYQRLTKSALPQQNLDFIFTNSILPDGTTRHAKLRKSFIGHSELCIRTAFLKGMPPHKPIYGQDWLLIQDMLKAGAKYRHSSTATYHIGHLPTAGQVREYTRGQWPWWKKWTNLLRGRRAL